MKNDAKSVDPAAVPAVIVFGSDENGRAHASWFPLADALLAERAAGLMGMQVLKVTSDEHRAVAAELPAGRVFSSGKGFVPFCAKGSFDRLSALDGAFKPEPPAATKDPLPEPANIPAKWDEISNRSLVLAGDPEGTGWFTAIVVEERGDIYGLRWIDWPDLPTFVRRREHLSLLSAVAHKTIGDVAGQGLPSASTT